MKQPQQAQIGPPILKADLGMVMKMKEIRLRRLMMRAPNVIEPRWVIWPYQRARQTSAPSPSASTPGLELK